MSEYSNLLERAVIPTRAGQDEFDFDEAQYWGGTPELRKLWLHNNVKIHIPPKSDTDIDKDTESGIQLNAWKDNRKERSNKDLHQGSEPSSDGTAAASMLQDSIAACAVGTPGLLIALVLNLFLSMSFGQAFFPTSWVFPPEVPRAIGVQMFLFSTLICQVVMTAVSEFPTAMGMMMVENIPFMHIIAQIAVKAQGPGVDTFATVFVAFSLSTIAVGVAFYLLGKFKIGNAMYFFPRHVIIGCIGGIGIFIIQTGVEVSSDRAWEWSFSSIIAFFDPSVAVHWAASLGFVIILRLILHFVNMPLLPPFYFIAIPPAFYLLMFAFGFSSVEARAHHWFFPESESVDPLLIWELTDFSKVDWAVIGDCVPTIIALCIFSLMHVPINIPSLSMSTHRDVDINKELVAHGYSNLLSGMCGGLQNYLCYSNSLLYYKCKGGGKASGYLMSAIIAVFFYLGPSAVYYMPRVMPGCLLIHIGIDLTAEALVDSWGAFDVVEYSSIVAITVVMTFYGMTAGLGLGVLCATLTFTIQASWRVHPIRGKMCGRTLRSSRWRPTEDTATLNILSRHITVVQLQGNLFFGNATLLAAEVEKMLNQAHTSEHIWYIILDFTLVVGIDSSAAETILKIFKTCRHKKVRLCYCAGAETGFPCAFPLSEAIMSLDKETIAVPCVSCSKCGAMFTFLAGKCSACGRKEDFTRAKWVCKSNSLEGALAWCEDIIIAQVASGERSASSYGSLSSSGNLQTSLMTALAGGSPRSASTGRSPRTPGSSSNLLAAATITPDVPVYLHQIYNLCRNEPRQKIERLMSYFVSDYVDRGSVLWVQGAASDRALLLISGRLQHLLEEEAGTIEVVYPGHLVGEYGLLNHQMRAGTLTAIEDCQMLVLTQEGFEAMARNDPYSAFVFSKICMAYLGRRVMHVSNRIWESNCLPV